MSEWDYSTAFTEPIRNQIDYYINLIYMKGYKDAIREMEELKNE